MALAAMEFLGENRLELGPAETAVENRLWRFERDGRNFAWLVLDDPSSSANTVGEDVLRELAEAMDVLEADPPEALVLRSAKPAGFIAGADINQFVAGEGGDVEAQLRQAHDILDRIENADFPSIAVVHGYALGVGFELALACDYRIAIEGAYFGFPEVMLGLHPGLGGTYRLTELIDPVEAMTLMLTGKSAHTKKAKRLGIADEVTVERHVRNAVLSIAAKGKRPDRFSIKSKALDFNSVRGLAAGRMRSETEKKAPRENYPAPHELIDLWEAHGDDREEMRAGEIRSFANLLKTETSKNLVRAFFLRENLKDLAGDRPDIRHVHVVGAGTMGAEIATWCAIKGFNVTLFDISDEALGAAVRDAVKICEKNHLSSQETRDALDRLVPDPSAQGVAKSQLVIEAAPEREDLKTEIYRDLEARLPEDAIIATNTSSLSVATLAGGLERPERFAGLHFFNPVSRMELVEVVSHDKASEATLTALRGFAGSISRLPAPVRDYPGFLVNRALTPYLLEALLLMDEGYEKEIVDAAAEQFGMPLGPVELADRVGLDICQHVGESLRERLERPVAEAPKWFGEMIERGETGKKAGQGFYSWKDGEPQKADTEQSPPPDMADRLVLPMLNACVECLREGIVEDEDVLDGSMIFATGFAPFRGGPMRYARERGPAQIREKLKELTQSHGDRFKPDEGWTNLG